MCNIIIFASMKSGEKLLEKTYLLQVKDLHNKTVSGSVCRSLRQAVITASEWVENMDTYSKVYREFTVMKGAYAGVFFAKHKADRKLLALVGRKPSQHLLVLIKEAEVQKSEVQLDIHSDTQKGFFGDIGELMSE
jgi:hypothetical protein